MKKVIALISILILSSCAKYSEIQSYSFAQVSGIAEILKKGCKEKNIDPTLLRQLEIASYVSSKHSQSVPGFYNNETIKGADSLNEMVEEFVQRVDAGEYSSVYCTAKLGIISVTSLQLLKTEGSKNR